MEAHDDDDDDGVADDIMVQKNTALCFFVRSFVRCAYRMYLMYSSHAS